MTVPTLTGQSLFDGSAMNIAPTGKPMVVVYLAHWCPHCQAEVPRLVELGKAGKLDGIDVYGVAAAGQDDAPELPAVRLVGGRSVVVPDDGRQRAVAPRPRRTGSPRIPTSSSSTRRARSWPGPRVRSHDDDIVAAVNALKAGKPVDLGSGASSSK